MFAKTALFIIFQNILLRAFDFIASTSLMWQQSISGSSVKVSVLWMFYRLERSTFAQNACEQSYLL